jgi:hypothetical protein
MDISVVSDFSYSNEQAWNDFLLINGTTHARYRSVLQAAGINIVGGNLFDMEDSKEGRADWLQTHYIEHTQIADSVGLAGVADLTDVELNDDAQFSNWLQLHAQAHQIIDAILNI